MRHRQALIAVFTAAFALVHAAPARAQGAPPVPDFTYAPATPQVGVEIQFTDTTADVVFGWFWNFGDGDSSGTQNPAHTFAAPGLYNVTLTVLDRQFQQGSVTKAVNVSPAGTTVADFKFDPVNPLVNQTVTFTDLSTNNPTAWAWDFGDGATSTLKNPTHAFATAGDKAVKLTASAGGSSSSVTKTVTVAASPITASFAFFPTNPTVGQTVSFQDLSSGSPTAWNWAFGDGGTSTLQNPTYVYAAAGSFRITLTASGGGGSDKASKTITVNAAPTGSFSARIASMAEVTSDAATNGNGKPEPGERVFVSVTVSNGTSRTQPAVVGTLLSNSPGVAMVVDQVEYGTLAAGASAAAPGVPFLFHSDPSVPCGATLNFDFALSYGGQPAVVMPLSAKLGSVPCAPPKDVAASVALDEGSGTATYSIGVPVAISFYGLGSRSITGYKIELSRDGGATFPDTLSDNDPALAGVGPHIVVWGASGPETARARLRVTAKLAGGATAPVSSVRDITITAGPGGRGIARLPVVVQSSGALGTFFTTETTFASVDRAAAVNLTFTPVGGLPIALPRPVVLARGTRFFPDIFQPFRDQGVVKTGSGLVGTLTATFGGVANPVVQARVVNIPENGIGTFGLSFLSRLEGGSFTDEAWISGLLTSAQYRSNLSIAHQGGGSRKALELDVELYDGSTGRQVGGSPQHVVLQPDGFFQINNFQNFTVTPGVVHLYRLRRTSGDDQFRAYGTIIDGVTGDSAFVDASAPAGDAPSTAIRLASVVEASGLFGSFFTSDAVFVNRSAAATTTVSLRLDASGQGSFTIPNAFVLLPRQAQLVSSVVQYFRDHGAALTGTVVGPLTATFAGGDGYVLVRTSSAKTSQDPRTGTYGLAFAGRRPAEEATNAVLLVGVRKSSSYRTNLSLVHQGTSGPITLSYQIVSATTNIRYVALTATLQPGGFFQANDVVAASNAPAGDYYVTVTRSAGTDVWEAYLTILDNVTNDGSFVEMVKR